MACRPLHVGRPRFGLGQRRPDHRDRHQVRRHLYTQKHVYAVSLTSRLDSAGESVVAEVPCVEVLEVIASIKIGDDEQGQVMIPLGNGEFSAPAMSAAHYQVHEDSFGVEQIFLAEDRDISYNISCETSMAACETNPFLLCDVLPSTRSPLRAVGLSTPLKLPSTESPPSTPFASSNPKSDGEG